MSDVKNVKVACATDNGNTRTGLCWTDIGIPRGIIFVDRNATFTTASIAAFKTALEASLLNDDPNARSYPIQNIVEPTDSTTKTNMIVFPGDGTQVAGGENATTMEFRWYEGGFCLHYSLRQKNRQTKAFFILDSNGQLIGTDAGAGLMKGIVGYNYTEPFTWAVTNATVATYKTMLSWRPNQTNENVAILDFNNDGGLGYLENLQGLFNVAITQAVAPTSTVVSVKATVVGCGSSDLYDLYAAALAVPGAWKVNRVDTGGTIVVSAVASSATFNGWLLTLTAATGLTVNVSLVGPTELAALGTPVLGYASKALVQIIP